MLCSFLFSINLSSVGTECMDRKQSGSLLIPKQLFFTCLHVYFYSHDRFDLKKNKQTLSSAWARNSPFYPRGVWWLPMKDVEDSCDLHLKQLDSFAPARPIFLASPRLQRQPGWQRSPRESGAGGGALTVPPGHSCFFLTQTSVGITDLSGQELDLRSAVFIWARFHAGCGVDLPALWRG